MKDKGPKNKKNTQKRREEQRLTLHKFASARQSGAQKIRKEANDHKHKALREYSTLLKKMEAGEDAETQVGGLNQKPTGWWYSWFPITRFPE